MGREITVVIPAYNAERHIGKIIESLAGQSFNDFELIVVNDGSTDKTEFVALDAIKKNNLDGRVITRENGGQSSARNTGIKAASGKWLVMPDADDYLQCNYLRDLHDMVKKTGSEVGFCDINMVADKNLFEESRHDGNYTTKKGRDFFIDFIKHDVKIGPYCLIIDLDFLKKNKIIFNECMRYSEEFVFITELLYNAGSVVHVERTLYNYCLRPNSVSTSISLNGILDAYDELKKYEAKFNSNDFYDVTFRKIALKRWILASAHFCAKVMDYKKYEKTMRKLNAKSEIGGLIGMKDVGTKTKMAAALFCLSSRAFYAAVRRV